MTTVNLPVLKAWKRVFDLLICIHENPYNREGFQDAVLEIYPGKEPKSVFRGMAIPTLRNLGFIIGYGKNIRISANGALVHSAHGLNDEEGFRSLRAIILEFDINIGFISYLKDIPAISLHTIYQDWILKIEILDTRVIRKPEARERAARERINDWINFLVFANLLYSEDRIVRIDPINLQKARTDIDYLHVQKKKAFLEFFFTSYRRIVAGAQKGIKTVEIESLRKELAIRVYEDSRMLLTETQFDALFSDLPKSSETYSITLGRSMGADEKLFIFQGKYYQTLSIRQHNHYLEDVSDE